MQPQDVAEHSSSTMQSEALSPQAYMSGRIAYLFALSWAMFQAGNPKIASTSNTGQPCPKNFIETDRSIRCQKASSPFWRLAWSPLWQLAHSQQKKNTLWLSQHRSRLSQLTLENISNAGYCLVIQEQAAGRPVPVCPRPLIKGSRPC